jgi:receptor protein-tyrosine kinase
MSRVHEALRRAERAAQQAVPAAPPPAAPAATEPVAHTVAAPPVIPPPSLPEPVIAAPAVLIQQGDAPVETWLNDVQEFTFNPSPDSILIDGNRPHDAPTEEFRSLRTRLNHMQSLTPMHNVVVTSASPAEGKSMTAANMALAQSHLPNKRTLLIDFDFRRPTIHSLFGIDRSPGMTDYLLGKATLPQVMRRVAGSQLYVIPAGEAVINPLELLNLPEVKRLLDRLPQAFDWVYLDSPPLLFAADANLLSTLCHGTVLVVRIGATTIDTVTRAMQSLCENNVIGIVVNGARRGELYSKYTYYHSYYTPKDGGEGESDEITAADAPVETEATSEK